MADPAMFSPVYDGEAPAVSLRRDAVPNFTVSLAAPAERGKLQVTIAKPQVGSYSETCYRVDMALVDADSEQLIHTIADGLSHMPLEDRAGFLIALIGRVLLDTKAENPESMLHLAHELSENVDVLVDTIGR